MLKKEQERQTAMRDKGLTELPSLSLGVQVESINEDDMKKFERATALMDEVTKKRATEDFAAYGDIKAVYGYLDAELQKELERIDALAAQNKLIAEQKQLAEKNKQAGDAMRERNMTAAERYQKQLDDVARLESVNAIDPKTALRERMAIQSQIQQQVMGQVPSSLTSGNQMFARSMEFGSAEYQRYTQDIKSLNDKSKSQDPQVKELAELKKKLETEIAEMRTQTKLLQKLPARRQRRDANANTTIARRHSRRWSASNLFTGRNRSRRGLALQCPG